MFISSSIKVKARVTLTFRVFVISLFFIACSEAPHKKGYQLYQKGEFQKALPLLMESCTQRNIDACKLTASIYANHKITDYQEKILQSLELACEYGEISSCYFVSKGYELIKLYPKMIQTLENGCQWGDPTLCLRLGLHYFQGKNVKQNTQKSLELWIKSCYGRKKQGCDLAISLLQKSDPSNPQIASLKKFWESL